MNKKNIDIAFNELYNCKSHQIWDLSNQFVKNFAKQNRVKVIECLVKYIPKAELHQNILVKFVSDLVQIGENQYAEFFHWAIKEGFGYYAVEGLIKSEGEKCYPFLVDFIQNSKKEISGKTVITLAKYSGQPFDYDLPNDPAYWKSIPIEKILKWQENGYPQGEIKVEKAQSFVVNPKTDLDFIVQKLENKLLKNRKMWRVGSMEYNRQVLEPASEEILAEIAKKWQLPTLYLEFLQKYSPKSYLFSKMITLYGANQLIEAQSGYAFNGITGEKITNWEENWVVIAQKEGDPYIFDLHKVGNGDCPIYKASHGAGKWKFKKVTNGFLEFLAKL